MTYLEKLKSDKWLLKRDQIIRIDNFTCRKCQCADYTKDWVKVYDAEGICELYYYDKTTRNFQICIPEKSFSLSIEIHNLNIPILNVHHNKYILGREPWDYDNCDLMTLCSHCHKNIHDAEKIPVYSQSGNKLMSIETCSRCGGFGYIPQFSHVQDGICFDCWGEGSAISLLGDYQCY